MTIRTAVYTISTRSSAGERDDVSGPLAKQIIQKAGGEIVDYAILPDDRVIVAARLRAVADQAKADLILTTGGTGLSLTDVTPEATLGVIERRLPGFEEVMRIRSFEKTPYAILSRAVAGTRGRTLIVNLPGNPKGVQENLEVLLPVLPHAVKVIQKQQIADTEHIFQSKD